MKTLSNVSRDWGLAPLLAEATPISSATPNVVTSRLTLLILGCFWA
ncbi:MAG: hypothetical protein HC917_26070 [Richelia sp. SM2_1_7]|nr:hypothetical protein [Richelia sp. SM2_1_7]